MEKKKCKDSTCLISLYDRKGNIRDKAIVDAASVYDAAAKKLQNNEFIYLNSAGGV